MSPLVHILLLSASHISSEFSHAANASLALCKAARLSVRIFLVLEGVNVGGLSMNVDGSFGFALEPVGKLKTHGRLQVSFWHSGTRVGQDQDYIVILHVFYPSYLR